MAKSQNQSESEAGLRSLDTANRARQIPLRDNYTSPNDPVPSEVRDRARTLEALPDYARGLYHYCSQCGEAFHTLCPSTGKSEKVLITDNGRGLIRAFCTGCGEQNSPNPLGTRRKCANCDPSLGDWNPNSPQNLAIKAEHKRKSRERAEVERNRDEAWPVIKERLIDEYLQAQGLKWRIEA